MKKLILMVLFLLLTGCSTSEPINEPKEILSSGDNVTLTEKNEKLDSEIVEAYINIINSMENEGFEKELKYSLVYFDNDDIPELVVDLPDYWLTVCTFKDGEVVNIIGDEEYLVYGVSGLVGYDYSPKKAVITSSSHDNERYGYTSYYELNEDGVITNSYTIQTIIFSEDESEIGKQKEEGDFIYTNIEECDFEALEGIKSAEEIILQIKDE